MFRLQTILAGFSLLLCIAASILWIRSYSWIDEGFLVFEGDGYFRISSCRGSLMICEETPEPGEAWGGLKRLSYRRAAALSLSPGMLWPAKSPVQLQRWGFRYDAVPQGDVARARPAVLALRHAEAQEMEAKRQLLGTLNDQRDDVRAQELMANINLTHLQRILAANAALRIGQWTHVRRQIGVPIGLFVVGAVLPPSVGLYRFLLIRRWRRRNACTTCGYDMRATAGRCPECGTKLRGLKPGRTIQVAS